MPKHAYHEFLTSKKDLFLQVEKQLGIDPNRLGLGCFPDSHKYPTTAVLVPIHNIGGSYYFVTSHDNFVLSDKDQPLVVKPYDNRIISYVVSIFHKNPFGIEDINFVRGLSENGLRGLIAHEGEEYLYFCKGGDNNGIRRQIEVDFNAKKKDLVMI